MDMSELRSGWTFMCVLTTITILCFVMHARGMPWIVAVILCFPIAVGTCIIIDSLSFVKFPEKDDKKKP